MNTIVNLNDVAKKANVSTATVSHVLNKTRFVSNELVIKVEDAMRELGYQPIRRKRRRSKTNTIGLVLPNSSSPILSSLANFVEDQFYAHGYTVIVCNSMYDINKEIEILKTLRSKMVDGIIIIPSTDNLIDEGGLKKSRIPIVALDREIRNMDVDTIRVDYEETGSKIVDSLFKLGYRNFGYIDRKYDQSHSIARRQGFEKAIDKNNLVLKRNLFVRSPGFDFSDGYAAAEIILKEDSGPTVIICPNDIIAIGAMKKILESGKRIPEDYSLVGYGNIPVSGYTTPSLTTLRYPSLEMSKMACEILIKKMDDPFFLETQKIIVEVDDLIIRGSTSVPNK